MKEVYFLDPFYLDSFEKWSYYYPLLDKMSRNMYFFEKNGVIIQVNYYSSYYGGAEIRLISPLAYYYFKYDVEEAVRRKEWKNYLREDLKKWELQRQSEEDKYRKLGITIDEKYQNKPLRF